jgi:hypothetical protein
MNVHRLAEELPPMTDAEYRDLVADIRANGLKVPLVVYQNRLLDGRHRLRACEELGVPVRYEQFAGTLQEAEAHMLSLNIHRRHLTMEQRKRYAAAELRADSARSDRVIAAKAGISPTSVGTIRSGLGVQIGHPTKRVGLNGVAQAAAKGKRDTGLQLKNGRAFVLRAGHKTSEERAAEIRPLAARGMSRGQIAEHLGIARDVVSTVAKANNIEIPADFKARRIDAHRVLSECVTTLCAVAAGIEQRGARRKRCN